MTERTERQDENPLQAHLRGDVIRIAADMPINAGSVDIMNALREAWILGAQYATARGEAIVLAHFDKLDSTASRQVDFGGSVQL